MFKDRRIRASARPTTAGRIAYRPHRSHSAPTGLRGAGMAWQTCHWSLVARGRFPFPARQANDDGYLAL